MNLTVLLVSALTVMTMALGAPKPTRTSAVQPIVSTEGSRADSAAPVPSPSRASLVDRVARFIRDTTPRLSALPREAERIPRLIVDAALAHELDPLPMAAIVRHESLDFRRGRQEL